MIHIIKGSGRRIHSCIVVCLQANPALFHIRFNFSAGIDPLINRTISRQRPKLFLFLRSKQIQKEAMGNVRVDKKKTAKSVHNKAEAIVKSKKSAVPVKPAKSSKKAKVVAKAESSSSESERCGDAFSHRMILMHCC